MKTTINLLIRKSKKRAVPSLKGKLPPHILPLLLLAAFLFLGHIAIKRAIAGLKTEGDKLKEKQSALEKEFSQLSEQAVIVEGLKKETDEYRGKLNILENLFTERRRISEVLKTLSNIVPEGLWLKTLELKKNPNTAVIDGWALSHSQVVSFIAALEKSLYFSTVGLEQSMKSAIEEETVIEFKISAKLNI